ncbi:MAG: hypothetical protein AAF974_06970 [Cyanobacteria bacterium P01_E01_bin.34]
MCTPCRPRRSRWLAMLLALALAVAVALGLGWELQAEEETNIPEWAVGYQLGAQVYVESCGSCHTALPPEVMPQETWRVLLQSEEHYGVNIDVPQGPFLQAAWGFMQDFSRARNQFEEVPYRLDDSRYFRALHPQVEFAETIRPTGCIDCHPRANVGNFVNLSDEWQ